MLNGRCSSCGAMTVHCAKSAVEQGRLTFAGRFNAADTMDYICVTCGYLERHVVPGKQLERVAANWARVVPLDEIPPHDQIPPGNGTDRG